MSSFITNPGTATRNLSGRRFSLIPYYEGINFLYRALGTSSIYQFLIHKRIKDFLLIKHNRILRLIWVNYIN